MKTFEELGGIEILRKVSKVFYDKIYADPWIGLYFKDIKQEHIENQQVDFMTEALGGPSNYSGHFVPKAHAHMMISEELFQLREKLLNESFVECAACEELVERWNKIDRAFKSKVVKSSPQECKQRYVEEPIMDFPNPSTYKNKKAA